MVVPFFSQKKNMKWNGRPYRPANAQFITKKKPFDFQEALKPYGEKEMPVWNAIVAVNNETAEPEPSPTNTETPTNTPTNTPTPSVTPQVQWNAEVGYYAGYSINSNNWFEIGYPAEGYLTFSTLASNGTRWAATGTLETGFLNRTFYSNNGSTWITGNNSPYAFIGNMLDLTSNGDKFILAGSSTYTQILTQGYTTVAYSNDGITYSAGTITVDSGRALPSTINSTAFNGDMWIGGGFSSGATANRTVLIYSYDGINWSGQTNTLWTGTTAIRSVAYGNGRWVATSNVGGNARIAVSYDGFNWSASTNAADTTIFGTSTTSGYINNVIWFNDKFIATANASGATTHTVCYSYDGFEWSAATSTKSLISGVLNIASNKSDFVMIGATPGGAVYQSSDGINWSANTTDQSVVFNNGAIGRISNKQPEQQSPNPSQTPSQTASNTPTPTNTPTNTGTPTQTPTNTGTPTQTPTTTTTLTATATQTPTNTGTPSPTPTINYVVWTLSATGATGYDVCSLPATTNYYSNANSGSAPNVSEYIYYDSALTQPVADNTYIRFNYSGTSVAILVVNQNGTLNPGQISGVDPNFICVTQTPTPTTTQTQTPTQTGTPPVTPTNTQTPTQTGTPTPSPQPSGTTEADTYLRAVVDAGGTGITSTVSAATRTLFTSLVSNNLWESVTAFYPMLGGTSGSCKFNAKNPVDTNAGYRLVFNGGWTFNASGATSNGTNAYADTYLSSSALTLNSQHLSVYMSNNNNPVGAGKTYIGSNATRANYLAQDGTPLFYYGIGGSSAGYGPGTINSQGYLIGASSGSTDESLFKNGTLIDTQGSGTRVVVNPNIYIAAMNNNGSTIQYYANQYSFATIGSGLTATQAATLTTIINTFQTSLSRNTF